LRPGPVAHPENGVTSCTHGDIARQGRCPQARSVESIADTVTDFWRSRILSARVDEGRIFIRLISGFGPGYQAGIETILGGYQVLGERNIGSLP